MSNKKLIVITSGSYPFGGAATNRHLSYLKGLVELGIDVKMYILQPANNQSIKSNTNKGFFNGIKYQYITPVTQKSKGVFSKISNKLNSIRFSLSLIKGELTNENNLKDINLLMLSTDPIEIIPFQKLASKQGVKIFHERTEFPFIGMRSFLQKQKLKLYLRIVKNFDGLFVITKAIKEYLTPFMDEKKIFHIPMTVEPERFDCLNLGNRCCNQYGHYIAYCGSMYSSKDGVPILIQAFDIFAETVDNINLVLIGDNSNKVLLKPILDEVEKSKHKNRIFFTGQVERDKMPELLCKANVLALARPDNIQAKGGFPTKLGEYLATGNPVVVTAVGEIPEFLTDNKNAFVCKPDSVVDFANKLISVFEDYKTSKKIGLQGKELVSNVFNYQVQAARLYKFIYE